jgi:hypothetical protein
MRFLRRKLTEAERAIDREVGELRPNAGGAAPALRLPKVVAMARRT